MDFMSLIFIKGFLVGFSVAAPIGPIGILCIRQSIAHGFWGGVLTGLGASIADIAYTICAGLFATALYNFVQDYDNWINFCAGVFLIYLAIRIYKSATLSASIETEKTDIWISFINVIILSFLSPITTILFISMFNSYNVFNEPLSSADLGSLALGVGIGATTWWVILSGIISKIYQLQPKFQVPASGLIQKITYILWPESRKTNTLSIFSLINTLSAITLSIYGMISFIKII